MIKRIPVLLAALLGAAIAAQFPAYYQQYLQHLGGRLYQAEARVQEISSDARSLNLSTEAYIESFLESDLHALEGARMRDSFTDAKELRATLAALRRASVFSQPFLFAARLNPAVAKSTMGLYKPAVPLSFGGIAYALLGALLGLSLAGLFLYGGRRLVGSLIRGKVQT